MSIRWHQYAVLGNIGDADDRPSHEWDVPPELETTLSWLHQTQPKTVIRPCKGLKRLEEAWSGASSAQDDVVDRSTGLLVYHWSRVASA